MQMEQKLENMRSVFRFVQKHPGCNSIRIAEHLKMSRSASRHWLAMLTENGYLERVKGKRGMSGCEPDSFTVTSKGIPKVAPERRESSRTAANTQFNRVMVKAKQLGLKRDAMIESFFGPAGAEA